jgi:alkylated DNA repair dioxygenase AlkB
MLDLFDTPVIPGLATASDFLSEEEEHRVIVAIDAVDMTPFRFQQWTGKRLTHSFGWKYDFQSSALSRSEPMPDWLLAIRDRAAAFAGLAPDELVQSLLIRYDEGAGIGWHKDRPIYEHVIGISMGAPAAMRFRRQRGRGWERTSSPLEPRGIYHLSGEVRSDWEHSIVEMDRTRYSITMRSFSAKGRALASAS